MFDLSTRHLIHNDFVIERIDAIDILHCDGAFLEMGNTNTASILESKIGSTDFTNGIGHHAT